MVMPDPTILVEIQNLSLFIQPFKLEIYVGPHTFFFPLMTNEYFGNYINMACMLYCIPILYPAYKPAEW